MFNVPEHNSPTVLTKIIKVLVDSTIGECVDIKQTLAAYRTNGLEASKYVEDMLP